MFTTFGEIEEKTVFLADDENGRTVKFVKRRGTKHLNPMTPIDYNAIDWDGKWGWEFEDDDEVFVLDAAN